MTCDNAEQLFPTNNVNTIISSS